MPKRKIENLSQRGETYYIDYYDKSGQRIRVSTKTNSRNIAIEIRDEYFKNLKSQLNKNSNGFCSIKQEYTFDDIALKFLEEKTRSCRVKTVKDYKFLLKNLFSFFTNKLIDNIDVVDLKSYQNYRFMNGCSDGLLRKEFVLLQSIFNYAEYLKVIIDNPFNYFKFRKTLKDYEPKERFLNPEEARKLIKNSNELLATLLTFLFNTGVRINEALNLLYTDVATDFQSKIQYITVRKEISKNKKDRLIPLNKEAMEQINRMKIKFPNSLFVFVDSKGNPYKTTPKKAFETAKRKSNLKDIGGFHITRHTAGSWWLQGTNLQGLQIKPLRIEIVKELLGHSTVLITEKHYAKLTKQNILLSLEKL